MLWVLDPKLSMLSTNRATTSVLPPTTATENIKTPKPTCMWELHKVPYTWQPSALPRTPHADLVVKLVIGMPDAKAPLVDQRFQTRSHSDVDTLVENKSRPTLLMKPLTMIPNVMKSMSTPLQSTLMHSLKLRHLSPCLLK